MSVTTAAPSLHSSPLVSLLSTSTQWRCFLGSGRRTAGTFAPSAAAMEWREVGSFIGAAGTVFTDDGGAELPEWGKTKPK